jgi:hypothetical protein
MPRGIEWVISITNKHCEFGTWISTSGWGRRAPSPKALATLLDENPGFWCGCGAFQLSAFSFQLQIRAPGPLDARLARFQWQMMPK